MRILIAEDDGPLAAELAHVLRAEHFAVDIASDGENASYLGFTEQYDAALLDIGLPVSDGLTVLEKWRAAGLGLPVLILTARTSWSDKAAGFGAGADDYLAKPFLAAEVIARLRALIRRAHGHSANRISCGDLAFDVQSGVFTLGGKPVSLTAFEWRILSALMLRKGAVVSRTTLAECAYEYGVDVDFKSMEVIIGRIRRKIGEDMIRTVRNHGYALAEPAQ
jgi:two-component system OmpR family response regulator